jgi:outer membrane lipoprotein-sorting protein
MKLSQHIQERKTLLRIGRPGFIMLVLMLMAGGRTIASGVTAENTPTTDTAVRGRELLTLLETRYKETQTYQGEFDQVKKSEVFLEEVRSKGKFWYQRTGRFRCEYLPPNAQVNLILDNMAYMYIPEIKQVEIYHFKSSDSPVKKLNHMLLGFGASVKDVLEVYDVRWLQEEETPEAFALIFKPIHQSTTEEEFQFEAIKIWVKKDALLPSRLVFIETGGDRTEVTLTNVEFNKKIKDSVFKPDFPKDAEVIEQN